MLKLVTKTFACFIILIACLVGEAYFMNLSHIEDELVRQSVAEYIEWCPYTDLCSIPASATFPAASPDSTNVSSRRAPCCQPCFCYIQCGSSCCPDIPTRYLTQTELRVVLQDTTRCQRLQYKPVDEESELLKSTAFLTVSECPLGYGDIDTGRKCIADYNDFNFKDDISEFVPVSNDSTIFKNQYCAICNGENIEGVDFWEIGIACERGYQYQPFTSLIGLKTMIDTNANCDLFFKPVDLKSFMLGLRCEPLIARCNVTGHWMEYDSDMERACLSYTSQYKAYKNIHCYMCNKGPGESVQTVCRPRTYNPGYNSNSFLTLLDFRGLSKDDSDTVRETPVDCPDDQVYDIIQGRCRLLLCPDYMYNSQGACTWFLKSTSMYDVIFTVEPRDEVKNYSLVPASMVVLYNTIWFYLSNTLKEKQSSLFICELFGFISLQRGFDELSKDFVMGEPYNLAYSDVEYFAFRLQIAGYQGVVLEKELQKIDSIFTNYSQVPGLLPYIIHYRQIPVQLFDAASAAYKEYGQGGNSAREALLSSIRIDPQVFRSLAASVTYSTNGITTRVAPMFPYTQNSCLSGPEYQLQAYCPKIELSDDEFTLNDNGVAIKATGHLLDNQDLIYTRNNTVLVCYKTYLLKNRLPTRNTAGSGGGMDPIMIVTVICLSCSLISLASTMVIYALFKQLRTLPGLNIIGLVCSLFVTHFLTLINGVCTIRLGPLCIGVGIMLHFSLLMAICWMSVCTFHMAKVFVNLEKMNHKYTNQCRLFTRYVVFTITTPLTLVVVNIIVSRVRSDHTSIGYDDVDCYLESRDMVLFTVAIPIGVVVMSNIGMFICVMIKVMRVPSLGTRRSKERNNLVIFAKLSTITGITWSVGFLYQFTNVEALAYVFVILNASQGVFIMVAFVVNRRVAGMLKLRYSDSLTFSSSRSELPSLDTIRNTRHPPVVGPNHTKL